MASVSKQTFVVKVTQKKSSEDEEILTMVSSMEKELAFNVGLVSKINPWLLTSLSAPEV